MRQPTAKPAPGGSHRDGWRWLLVDPDSMPDLERELRPLGGLDGERALRVYAVLRNAKWFDAQHRRDSRRLKRGRAWIKQRNGWVARLRKLRGELDGLYEIDGAFVATLRWHGWMKPGALEKSDKTEAAFDRLLRVVERDPVLTVKTKRPRGNQPQPFKGDAHRALMRLGLTKDSGTTLLRLVGVKPLDT